MEYNDKLIYDLWLTGIKGIGPAAQHALLDAFGFPEEAYHASEADLIDAGISESRRKLILEARDLDDARQELEKCRKSGIFLLTNRDEIYPESFPDSVLRCEAVVPLKSCTVSKINNFMLRG